jgi:dihydroxyacid dehydratase/phosphogluconate dehydratase
LGEPLAKSLDWWTTSERRKRLRDALFTKNGIDPDNVIMEPARAKQRGLTGTVCFPKGNLAPEGSVIKSTAIDPAILDADGAYRKTGPARVFYTERDAINAVKGQGDRPIKPGDVLVLCGRGPMGSGMEEIAQITIALKNLSWGCEVAVLTDARFSGFSSGPCIGHITPEALAGGPIGKLRDGDLVRIVVDRQKLDGSVDLVGFVPTAASTSAHSLSLDGPELGKAVIVGPEEGSQELTRRQLPAALSHDARLPDDTRLWAALQNVSGGSWGGCVYDVDKILARLYGTHQ